jgi:hypothetical protein
MPTVLVQKTQFHLNGMKLFRTISINSTLFNPNSLLTDLWGGGGAIEYCVSGGGRMKAEKGSHLPFMKFNPI